MIYGIEEAYMLFEKIKKMLVFILSDETGMELVVMQGALGPFEWLTTEQV